MTWKTLAALAALAAAPALAAAQQPTPDSAKPPVVDSAAGKLAPSMGATNALGLTMDQTKELQNAINASGCDAGPATGMLTDKTHSGIACVRKERHIQGTDLNDVLKSLGLPFTAKPGMPPTDSSEHGRTG